MRSTSPTACAALMGLIFFSGCASSSAPRLYTKRDPVRQQTVIGVIGNRLNNVHSDMGGPAEVFFSPQRVVGIDGLQHFQFVVQVKHEHGAYLLMKPGPSLTLEVDGVRRTFTTPQGSGPRRVVTKRWGVATYSESAVYNDVSEGDIDHISRAAQTRMILLGAHGELTADFSEQNFAAFEAMIEKIVSAKL